MNPAFAPPCIAGARALPYRPVPCSRPMLHQTRIDPERLHYWRHINLAELNDAPLLAADLLELYRKNWPEDFL